MEAKECGRCQGKGYIRAFSHVCNGVCFRCWGTGEDVTGALRGLAGWLSRARQEFKMRTSLLRKEQDPKARAAIQKELDLLTKLGKKNRAEHDRMLATQAMNHKQAVGGI